MIREISYWNLPIDDPLPWLLADSRRLSRRISDSLWMCPIDGCSEEDSREGRLVIEVHDGFNP